MGKNSTSDVDAIARIAEYESKYKSIASAKERPAPVPVEAAFDDFVEEFGGRKISDLLANKSQMPLNADYIFEKFDVIIELKTLEGIYSGAEGGKALVQAFIDTGHTSEEAFYYIAGLRGLPEDVQNLIMRRMRRAIEKRIIKARKQLKVSKTQFGGTGTKSIILVAMDQPPLFGHKIVLLTLAKLMGDNYSDEHVDAVVYINPNVPIKIDAESMEYGGWYPFYRDDNVNDKLGEFVNLLGNRWLTYFAKRTGTNNPILEFESVAEMMPILDGYSVTTDEILEKRG